MKISDCTLRDFVNSPLIYSENLPEVEIAKEISKLAVDEIEINLPRSKKKFSMISAVVSEGVSISAFIPARRIKDVRQKIQMAHSLGIKRVTISIPVSEGIASIKLPTSNRKYILKLAKEAVVAANSYGIESVVTGEDSPGADSSFLNDYIELLFDSGASRFRYAESVSKLTPSQTRKNIDYLVKSNSKAQIEMHCHNMYGLGFANAMAGIESGATWVSGTFMGLGERGGNINILEALVTKKYLLKYSELDLSGLANTSNVLSGLLGIKVNSTASVIGEDAYKFELENQLENIMSYIPFNPSDIGKEIEVCLSGKDFDRTVNYIDRKFGLNLNPDGLLLLKYRLTECLLETKKPIDQNLLINIIEGVKNEC